MNGNLLNRRIHYWITPFLALPILIVIASGILLQMKKQLAWVQPPEGRGTGTVPVVSWEAILESVRSDPNSQAATWESIQRIDVRPTKGLAKVSLKSGREVQVDLGTGRVLQSAVRRSDWIESIHDGSFFAGDISKLGIFLPSAIGLLVLWVTGLWMFWLPLSVKRKRRKAAANAAAATLAAVVCLSLQARGEASPTLEQRPNIVFLLADDLGWGELGCYGQQKLRTPNLDRLASQGMRFTQHYSGAPVCAPRLLDPETPPTERPPMVWVFPEYGGQVAVRWDRWKLVRRELATRRPGPWELYDIESDPSESENLATRHPERLSEGRSLLAREMQDNPMFPVRLPDDA